MNFWMWGALIGAGLIVIGLFWPTKKGPRG